MAQRTTILDGLVFGEGPRWHDDALWFSDMHAQRIHRLTLDGDDTVLVETEDVPSGLGWLADGTLLVVAMETQRLLRLDDRGLQVHADLSGLARGSLNDMIVAADGTAYVGDMGYRILGGHSRERVPGQSIRVRPDGSAECAADDLQAPNGHALTADGRTLVIGESAAFRLTAFTVADDGTLHDRRVFAELQPGSPDVPVSAPDGICLDAEGAVWVCDPVGRRAIRVLEGGEVTDELTFDGAVPIACVLGGPDRRDLLVCVAPHWEREVTTREQAGRIERVPVAVPGAGRP